MPPIALSKTKVLSFLQCPKRLWLEQYSPELEDEDAFDQAAIATGRVVGLKAREVLGGAGGHLVSHERGLRAAVAETEALLASGDTTPVFEATFDHDGLTVLVDILDRSGTQPRIIEVKASTSVRDHHLHDCAIQAWTLQQLGIGLSATSVALIDKDFEYAGDGNYAGLFREVDLTPDIAGLTGTIGDVVAAARETLDSLDEPAQDIGPQCRSPYPCPFFDYCAPEQGEFPILGLGGRREPLYALMQAGHRDIRDLREDQLGSEIQQRIRQQTLSGEPYVGAELGRFVGALPYPRYYLDFETIAFAIPVWAGTRPYQALPFQWSCHIDTGDGPLGHAEFLDLSGEPPMRQAAEALLATLGDSGPILVYTGYEQRVLNELGARYPDLAAPLAALAARLVDLHPIARAHYYHPEMRGSWSIKAILPTIAADIDYAGLDEVGDGEAAQAAYLEAIDPDTAPARREVLREALLAYCRLDTEAMVRLVEFFGRASQ